jgi:cell division protein FtsZ
MKTNADHAAAAPSPATSPRNSLPIKVIGLGSAGANLVEELMRAGFENVTCAVVSRDPEAMAHASAAERIHLGRGRPSRPRRAGSAPSEGSLAEQLLPRLDKLFEGVGTVFVVAGLGGRTGTELSAAVAKAAKEAGALSLAVVTLPFDCEGSLRRQTAEAGLTRLRAAADVVFCLPNQKTFPLIHKETSLADTFKVSNQLLADALRGMWRSLISDSVMGLPFSDLCALIQDCGALGAFAAAEVAGPDRTREVVERLFAHPLLHDGPSLADAEAIMVSVVGGPDLTVVEVNRLMEQINGQCQGAPVLMGAGVHASFKGSLAVMLMVAGAGEVVAPGVASSQTTPLAAARGDAPELHTQLLTRTTTARPHSRFVPPPPVLTPEQREQLIARQTGAGTGQRKTARRMRQAQLPLEIISKGRFDKSEPTIHDGEDLDMPTFIRRRLVLN